MILLQIEFLEAFHSINLNPVTFILQQKLFPKILNIRCSVPICKFGGMLAYSFSDGPCVLKSPIPYED